MNTKVLFTALTFLITSSFTIAQNKYHCLDESCAFMPGQQVYVFGNDVKLRSKPSAESEVLDLLKIGESVVIVGKTAFSWPYNGFDSFFYEVRYNNESTGYILGGLLALERKKLNGINYYFAYSKRHKKTFLNIRHVENGDYVEVKTPLSNTTFSITTYDDKGVPGLDGMFYIDYLSEACGVDGGGIYVFAHNGLLTPTASLTKVSDAGVYFHHERFIFPTDTGGLEDKILFKKEAGEMLDEATNWTKTSVEIRELSWIDGQLVPEFEEISTH